MFIAPIPGMPFISPIRPGDAGLAAGIGLLISISGIAVACGLGDGEAIFMPGMFISMCVGVGVGEDGGGGLGDGEAIFMPGMSVPGCAGDGVGEDVGDGDACVDGAFAGAWGR